MPTQEKSANKSSESSVSSGTHSYISKLYDDQSDRKAMNELVDKLFSKPAHKKRKASTKQSPDSSKYKQLKMSTFCNRSNHTEVSSLGETSRKAHKSPPSKPSTTKPNTRSSKQKVLQGKISKGAKKETAAKLPTINRWLKQENVENEKHSTKETTQSIKTKKPGKAPGKKSEKKKTFTRSSSGSFDKYGISTPSVEEILEYQKNLENQQKCIETFDEDESQESVELNFGEPESTKVPLDCKHLTSDEIDRAFDDNYQYVHDIFHGKRHSIRHERFKKENHRDQFTVTDLKYNTSTITFTDEQKQLLLSRLDKKFNQDETLCSSTTRYFFKVLLPELCTKIFMDVHHMTFEEATKYLDDRPVPHRAF